MLGSELVCFFCASCVESFCVDVLGFLIGIVILFRALNSIEICHPSSF